VKTFGELIIEMGFDKDSSLETQKAFFKHLANEAGAKTSEIVKNIETTDAVVPMGQQLSFDFETPPGQKKVS
jgi:hypothetical protein